MPKKFVAMATAALLLIGAIAAGAWYSSGGKFNNKKVKVGLLHSLSGTMAISESVLKDVALMTFAEINAKGGVNGHLIEPVVVDPKSDWPSFAQEARKLLESDKVAVVFGCWTSVSRKHVLPAFEELNGLLFYPVQYEGEELSKNVFYTGAAPNQQAIPAADYMMSPAAGSAKRIVLLGTDYVYPRTTNKILRTYLNSKGIEDADILEIYHPFGFSNWADTVDKILNFAGTGKKVAVISTVNGDSNVSFYEQLGKQRVWGSAIPVIAFSVGEQELASIQGRTPTGHFAAWNYFMSLDNPKNKDFKAKWAAWSVQNKLPNAGNAITNDPMEATYIGIHLWKQAVEKAGSFDVDKVRVAMAGQSFDAPSGMTVKMDEKNHHLHRPVYIGEIAPDKQFKVVSQSDKPIRAQPWSQYVAGNEKRKDEPDGPTSDAVRLK
jgi:urea transport system substrate-binding protein